MSDELEARLKSVQKDLADVHERVLALSEQLADEDAPIEQWASKVAAQLAELNEKKDAVSELELEVEALRQEAAQVRGAIFEP